MKKTSLITILFWFSVITVVPALFLLIEAGMCYENSLLKNLFDELDKK